jgi:uncharacterized repeat protein (TIGR03943 family)
MFVYNLKINKNFIFRLIIIIIVIVAIFILGFALFNFYNRSKSTVNNCLPDSSIANIKSSQYTNILKQVYDDVDTYVGQSINFTGYVYKLYDLKDTEFVLARDMLINSDSQTVVVGFLCSYDKANDFKEGTWVNITGTIIKGYYHNEIPVIDITKIEETSKPDDCYVYPPEDTYIPTSTIF